MGLRTIIRISLKPHQNSTWQNPPGPYNQGVVYPIQDTSHLAQFNKIMFFMWASAINHPWACVSWCEQLMVVVSGSPFAMFTRHRRKDFKRTPSLEEALFSPLRIAYGTGLDSSSFDSGEDNTSIDNLALIPDSPASQRIEVGMSFLGRNK